MKKNSFVLILCFAFSALMSCASSPDAKRCQGEELLHAFLEELQEVHSAADLQKRRSRFEQIYLEMAELMVELDGAEMPTKPPDPLLNAALRQELERVYALPRGQESLEAFQAPALEKLAPYLATS